MNLRFRYAADAVLWRYLCILFMILVVKCIANPDPAVDSGPLSAWDDASPVVGSGADTHSSPMLEGVGRGEDEGASISLAYAHQGLSNDARQHGRGMRSRA